MKVLVSGGRRYSDRARVFATLDALHAQEPIEIVIHGCCLDDEGNIAGADKLAQDWAVSREIDYIGSPAKWKSYGNPAGPIRNRHMLVFQPTLVIAFPGGRGTANMIRTARSAGVEIRELV